MRKGNGKGRGREGGGKGEGRKRERGGGGKRERGGGGREGKWKGVGEGGEGRRVIIRKGLEFRFFRNKGLIAPGRKKGENNGKVGRNGCFGIQGESERR